MGDAACKGQTEKFFPPLDLDEHRSSFVKVAKAICGRCPVKPECLDYALTFQPYDMHGIWAGMTRRELVREAKRRGTTHSRPTVQQVFDHRRVMEDRKLLAEGRGD